MKAFTISKRGFIHNGIDVERDGKEKPYQLPLGRFGNFPKISLAENIVQKGEWQGLSHRMFIDDIAFQESPQEGHLLIVKSSESEKSFAIFWFLGVIFNGLLGDNDRIKIQANEFIKIIAVSYDFYTWYNGYRFQTDNFSMIFAQIDNGGELVVPITYVDRLSKECPTRLSMTDGELSVDSEKRIFRSAWAEGIGKIITPSTGLKQGYIEC